MTKDTDKMADLKASLGEEMESLVYETTEVALSNGTTGVDEIAAEIECNVEMPPKLASLVGAVAAMEWVAQAIEEQFEQNMVDYKRHSTANRSNIAQDRLHSLYENTRMMGYIDAERRDELNERIQQEVL